MLVARLLVEKKWAKIWAKIFAITKLLFNLYFLVRIYIFSERDPDSIMTLLGHDDLGLY